MLTAFATSSASTASLWAVVSDVTAWPQHLPTFTSVALAGGNELGSRPGPATGVGDRFDVRQPGLPAAVYEITEWTPGTSFTWVARTPGVTTTAVHVVSPEAAGARIDLTLTWSGPLAAPLRWALSRRTQRMIDLEAATFAAMAAVSPDA